MLMIFSYSSIGEQSTYRILISAGPTFDPRNNTHPQFLLKVETTESRQRSFRFSQTESYVFSLGTSTTCQFATAFTLIGSQLYADGQLVTTSIGIQFQPLLGGRTTGIISNGFALINKVLQWNHSSFVMGTPVFCFSTSNTILVFFNPSAMPSGCILVTLVYVPCKSKNLSVSDRSC